jgi:type II secretory pathway component PulF
MEFRYTAATAQGGSVAGILEADSEENAERLLWDNGFTIVQLKPTLKLPALHELLPSVLGIKRRHVINFSTGLASLLEAGIPIIRALKIQSRFGNRAFREVLEGVTADVEGGSSLSAACATYPAVFPLFYVHLLRTGEQVGNLAGVLEEVAAHMEREEEIRAKVRRSLAYPAFVILLAIAAVVVLMAFVVPALTMIFEEFNAELPAMTRGLIAVSDFFEANIYYMIIAVAVIAISGFLYIRTPGGKRRKDVLLLKIPVIGNALLKTALARFTRSMSMLVGAGVTLVDALQLTSATTDNTVLAESVTNVRTGVGDGLAFSEAVAVDRTFPELMGEMIAVGEESGSLEEQLQKVSGFYQKEAEQALSMVTGMLTPALTIFVGVIIGLIAVTIFSSIYSMAGVLPD